MSAHKTLDVAFLTREVLPTSGGGPARYEFVSHMTSPDFAGARGAIRRTLSLFISTAFHQQRTGMHVVAAPALRMGKPGLLNVAAPAARRGVGRSILALVGGLCLIAPAAVKAITYTHFVSPNGSATSLCTLQQPCSLTRAVTLAGSASMPPGSNVLVQFGADGIYSQPALTFDGSGAAGNRSSSSAKTACESPAPASNRCVCVDAGPGPAIHLSTPMGRGGAVLRHARPTAPGRQLAADLGRGPAATVHDAVESTLRSLVSAARTPLALRSMRSRPRPERRGTIQRTTDCMSTSSTTPRRPDGTNLYLTRRAGGR